MEINKKGFTKRKLSYGVILFRTLFILLIGIVICLLVELYKDKKECVKTPKNEPKVKCDTITSWITVYHPTIKECNSNKNITSNGERGYIGSCAASQKMFDYFINYGDTVEVCEGLLKGKYIVNDKAGSKIKLVDIWRPINDSLSQCYESKIIVKPIKIK